MAAFSAGALMSHLGCIRSMAFTARMAGLQSMFEPVINATTSTIIQVMPMNCTEAQKMIHEVVTTVTTEQGHACKLLYCYCSNVETVLVAAFPSERHSVLRHAIGGLLQAAGDFDQSVGNSPGCYPDTPCSVAVCVVMDRVTCDVVAHATSSRSANRRRVLELTMWQRLEQAARALDVMTQHPDRCSPPKPRQTGQQGCMDAGAFIRSVWKRQEQTGNQEPVGFITFLKCAASRLTVDQKRMLGHPDALHTPPALSIQDVLRKLVVKHISKHQQAHQQQLSPQEQRPPDQSHTDGQEHPGLQPTAHDQEEQLQPGATETAGSPPQQTASRLHAGRTQAMPPASAEATAPTAHGSVLSPRWTPVNPGQVMDPEPQPQNNNPSGATVLVLPTITEPALSSGTLLLPRVSPTGCPSEPGVAEAPFAPSQARSVRRQSAADLATSHPQPLMQGTGLPSGTTDAGTTQPSEGLGLASGEPTQRTSGSPLVPHVSPEGSPHIPAVLVDYTNIGSTVATTQQPPKRAAQQAAPAHTALSGGRFAVPQFRPAVPPTQPHGVQASGATAPTPLRVRFADLTHLTQLLLAPPAPVTDGAQGATGGQAPARGSGPAACLVSDSVVGPGNRGGSQTSRQVRHSAPSKAAKSKRPVVLPGRPVLGGLGGSCAGTGSASVGNPVADSADGAAAGRGVLAASAGSAHADGTAVLLSAGSGEQRATAQTLSTAVTATDNGGGCTEFAASEAGVGTAAVEEGAEPLATLASKDHAADNQLAAPLAPSTCPPAALPVAAVVAGTAPDSTHSTDPKQLPSSSPQQGALFVVTLPRRRSPEGAPQPADGHAASNFALAPDSGGVGNRPDLEDGTGAARAAEPAARRADTASDGTTTPTAAAETAAVSTAPDSAQTDDMPAIAAGAQSAEDRPGSRRASASTGGEERVSRELLRLLEGTGGPAGARRRTSSATGAAPTSGLHDTAQALQQGDTAAGKTGEAAAVRNAEQSRVQAGKRDFGRSLGTGERPNTCDPSVASKRAAPDSGRVGQAAKKPKQTAASSASATTAGSGGASETEKMNAGTEKAKKRAAAQQAASAPQLPQRRQRSAAMAVAQVAAASGGKGTAGDPTNIMTDLDDGDGCDATTQHAGVRSHAECPPDAHQGSVRLLASPPPVCEPPAADPPPAEPVQEESAHQGTRRRRGRSGSVQHRKATPTPAEPQQADRTNGKCKQRNSTAPASSHMVANSGPSGPLQEPEQGSGHTTGTQAQRSAQQGLSASGRMLAPASTDAHTPTTVAPGASAAATAMSDEPQSAPAAATSPAPAAAKATSPHVAVQPEPAAAATEYAQPPQPSNPAASAPLAAAGSVPAEVVASQPVAEQSASQPPELHGSQTVVEVSAHSGPQTSAGPPHSALLGVLARHSVFPSAVEFTFDEPGLLENLAAAAPLPAAGGWPWEMRPPSPGTAEFRQVRDALFYIVRKFVDELALQLSEDGEFDWSSEDAVQRQQRLALGGCVKHMQCRLEELERQQNVDLAAQQLVQWGVAKLGVCRMSLARLHGLPVSGHLMDLLVGLKLHL